MKTRSFVVGAHNQVNIKRDDINDKNCNAFKTIK